MIKKIFFVSLGLILMPLTIFASSISMQNYAEVLVKNLQIGANYNMTQLVNLPLVLSNDSDQPQIIELTVEVPKGKHIKSGFEAIPDASWVTFGQKQVTIPPMSNAKTDVFIKIPDDRKYLGKSFHVSIFARQAPSSTPTSLIGFTLGVEGRLLFTIAPEKVDTAAPKEDLKYAVMPARIELKEAPLGKKLDVVTAEKKTFMVTNESNANKDFFIISLDPKDTVVTIDPGAVACPNPNFLTVEKEELSVAAGKSEPVQLSVLIPDQPEYRGKRFEFIVSVEMGARGLTQRYLRVFVETQK